MRRDELEHVIRAAASIVRTRELVIIGTSSLLGAVAAPPPELARSRDVDLYPLHAPELADIIEGAIGEASDFERHFGIYAQAVSPKTATLPTGWEQRLVKVQNENTDGSIGWCLEPHDLAASKLAAGREKDHEFVRAMARHHLLDRALLQRRVDALPLGDGHKERLRLWLSHQLAPERTDAPSRGR